MIRLGFVVSDWIEVSIGNFKNHYAGNENFEKISHFLLFNRMNTIGDWLADICCGVL